MTRFPKSQRDGFANYGSRNNVRHITMPTSEILVFGKTTNRDA